MDSIIVLSETEQRKYFEEAGNRLGLPRTSIEKDFWVCWILRELFRLPDGGERLTFKGGTSLSKGWKLIQRFSEDIDIVVDRSLLGFGGENSPEAATSPSACKKRLKRLKGTCKERVHNSLKPAMEEVCRTQLPEAMNWELLSDSGDPDEQTLLFRYPQLFAPGAAYLQPQVKIELGARSDTEPVAKISIVPYLAEVFTDLRAESEFSLRAVAPERTFWEKAMLLHEERYRPPEKPRKSRLARHYYDLACLIEKGVADQAVKATGLFERTAKHRQIYFEQTWMDYGTLREETLCLSPKDSDMAYWTKDYADMQSEMFSGDVPTFDQILAVVRDFEQRLNKAGFGAVPS